jgi:DNA polymerase (family 10)
MMAQQGKFLYQQAEPFAVIYEKKMAEVFGEYLIGLTGEMRRQTDIIHQIDFLIALPNERINEKMIAIGHEAIEENGLLNFKMDNSPTLTIHSCTKENAGNRLLATTGTDDFCAWLNEHNKASLHGNVFSTEEELFTAAGIAFIQPQHRESAINELYYNKYISKPAADVASIKGIIHSHSTWSDGSHSLEEMALAAKAKGLEYLVISDHSRAASYAGGLSNERVLQQHAETDRLNKTLAPFKIFKSIECDILGSGQLDYDDDMLQTFDLVIASVHSSLKMSEEKAMQRLLTAIENPFTLILGHMTGRLLLSRNGYPVNHKKIIDACAANQVVIELNAHPRRLDMDWRWISYALEKDVLISINPDAHSIEGFDDIRYGCIAAGKALLPASANLSSFSLEEFEEWLYDVRGMKGTLG